MTDDREYTTGELAIVFQGVIDKLDNLQKQNTKDHDEIKASLNAHEPRIRSLELWRSLIVGGLTILTFLITLFGIRILEKLFP